MGQGRAVALKGAQLCAASGSLLASGAEVGSITSSLMHTCPAVRKDNTQKTFKASLVLVKLCKICLQKLEQLHQQLLPADLLAPVNIEPEGS